MLTNAVVYTVSVKQRLSIMLLVPCGLVAALHWPHPCVSAVLLAIGMCPCGVAIATWYSLRWHKL